MLRQIGYEDSKENEEGNGQVNVAGGLELLASISRQVSSETSEEVHVDQTRLSSVRRATNSLRNARFRGG